MSNQVEVRPLCVFKELCAWQCGSGTNKDIVYMCVPRVVHTASWYVFEFWLIESILSI